MEVSDVRLCCGRDKDKRGEKLHLELGEEEQTECGLSGYVSSTLKVSLFFSVLSLYFLPFKLMSECE
jgi:hypothetical protein